MITLTNETFRQIVIHDKVDRFVFKTPKRIKLRNILFSAKVFKCKYIESVILVQFYVLGLTKLLLSCVLDIELTMRRSWL